MTFITVQKLLRLRALIQDPPLSSNDVLVEPEKELFPVVVARRRVDAIRHPHLPRPIDTFYLGGAVPSVYHTQTLAAGTIEIVHSLPSRMLKSSSKDEHLAEKGDVAGYRREGKVSVVSGKRTRSYTGPQTIWTDTDSFLPRAKPPPPLKRIKHVRNRSESDVSPPDATIPSRPSTSDCGSSGQSSRLHSTQSRSPRWSSDVPTLVISCEDSNQSAADVQPTLTRTNTRTTIVSQGSDDSDITFTPSSGNWKPPVNWAGPSKAVSGDRPKPLGWFTGKKRTEDSSKGGGLQVPTRLNRIRSFRKTQPARLADTEGPEDEEASVIRGRPPSPGVMVKIQCYEGGGWHEKPMADIIPQLRDLKFK